MARGMLRIKAVMDEERIAVVSQKLEPRLRDERNSRINVVCMRMYPNNTSRISRESAFCVGVR